MPLAAQTVTSATHAAEKSLKAASSGYGMKGRMDQRGRSGQRSRQPDCRMHPLLPTSGYPAFSVSCIQKDSYSAIHE